MKPKIKHPCDGMSEAERNAFDRIAARAPPKSSTQTLDGLVATGLVERHKVCLASPDRFGPICRYDYSVPFPVHMVWCEWMTRPRSRHRRKPAPPQRSVDDLPLFGAVDGVTSDRRMEEGQGQDKG